MNESAVSRRDGRVVTIGTFDGVHVGHRYLIERAMSRAEELGTAILAVTFEPVPAMVLRPDKFAGRICSAAEKRKQLEGTGVDEILTIRFDHKLSQQSPEEFMSSLVERTRLGELWVGEAFALGKNRVGDVARLAAIGRELGFDVIAAPLFPRYLFVEIDIAVQRWRVIQSTVGVSRLVAHGDAPVAVHDDVIGALRRREDASGHVRLDIRPKFKVGDPVRVLEGAFCDCLGIYEGMSDHERVGILLDLLGRKVRVRIDAEAIAAA